MNSGDWVHDPSPEERLATVTEEVKRLRAENERLRGALRGVENVAKLALVGKTAEVR